MILSFLILPSTEGLVHFTKFNSLSLLLVVAALAIRTSGDILMTTMQLATTTSASYLFMVSGWLVVAALFAFVTMIHRSMKHVEMINKQ
jgi:uncharacterized membrane protein YesL